MCRVCCASLGHDELVDAGHHTSCILALPTGHTHLVLRKLNVPHTPPIADHLTFWDGGWDRRLQMF